MAAGDIFKLTLHSTLGTEEAANVFHYRQTIGVLGGEQLASSWIDEVYDEIKALVSVVTVFRSVEWLNYNDLADFGIDTSIAAQTGARSGEALPSYNAWAFQYNRETRSTRNGAKRFSAIAESDQAYGAPAAVATDVINNCAASLGQLINFGGTEFWEPVIVRLNAAGDTPIVVNGVKNVTFKRITTQSSRKSWT